MVLVLISPDKPLIDWLLPINFPLINQSNSPLIVSALQQINLLKKTPVLVVVCLRLNVLFDFG